MSDLNSSENDAAGNFWFDDVGNTAQPCSGSNNPPPSVVSPDKTHWIEIALVDKEGTPVAGQAYQVTVPGGAVIGGSLNDKGRARIDGIDAGNCKVTFPTLDKDCWKAK